MSNFLPAKFFSKIIFKSSILGLVFLLLLGNLSVIFAQENPEETQPQQNQQTENPQENEQQPAEQQTNQDNTQPTNIPIKNFIREPTAADMSIGIAKYYPIEEDVEDGDIISIIDNQYRKSQKTYDVSVIGVVTENPAIEISDQEYNANEKRYPVMDTGTAYVKVTTKNGDIKKGDVLTTSDIPGVAMKADRPGFAIGVADEDVSGLGDEVKKIRVAMHLHYNYLGQEKGFPDKLTFTDIFAITKLLEYQSPSAVMKYIFAGTVVVVSIIFGYLTFARIASRGIEAVGRNPLASKAINFSIVVNVAITISIVLAGLILAYFIIVL